ncbi:uncharacterized protein BDZ99DRAFT_505408 [Mytilinidion resinicola]|uniref:Alpha/beta hydrolase fold-3 domain-containing protein n=1 Tax=Mytilinidion resinicola TaxID=574789 RepID=A0A6A6Z4A1_9PEZI|nr:uncharacterized protein BDZ99DRAFT_505408 [Mytilinidion resinicola]KAF2815648.1 hypothetical protein BDZ99DRAFT_505408 [Mytilinidion resinicola]
MSSPTPTVHQPLHPSLLPVLDPEYISFHNTHLAQLVPSESVPWDPASRFVASPMRFGAQEKVPVGSTRDIEKGDWQARVFTPKGEPEEGKWPCLLWFHGGGWVLGGLDSENAYLTRVCRDVKCVVISINYRHAPDHPYPAAADDSFAGLQWIVSEEGSKELGIDIERIAVGGLSAGGGLAATVTMRAALSTPPIPLLFQLLICPVLDNTATADSPTSRWYSNRHAPFLTPSRMLNYRNLYFKNPADWANFDASPILSSSKQLAGSPKTWIGVAECDLLAREAEDFGGLLKGQGVETEVVVYEGCTHSLLMLAGVMEKGRRLVKESCEALKAALHS